VVYGYLKKVRISIFGAFSFIGVCFCLIDSFHYGTGFGDSDSVKIDVLKAYRLSSIGCSDEAQWRRYVIVNLILFVIGLLLIVTFGPPLLFH
jgi:hypothetical protein